VKGCFRPQADIGLNRDMGLNATYIDGKVSLGCLRFSVNYLAASGLLAVTICAGVEKATVPSGVTKLASSCRAS